MATKKTDRVLATDTFVTAENGQSEVFKAGTSEHDIDKEFLDRIDNDSVWGDSGVEVDEATGDTVVVHDWNSKSQKELMEEVEKRGLAADSNKKTDLVAVLEADDLAGVSNNENDPNLQ